MNMRRASRNPRECAEAKDTLLTAQVERASRNPRECAVAKTKRAKAAAALAESQPARMRCGKAIVDIRRTYAPRRNPRECAVAKNKSGGKYLESVPVATRANALWQRCKMLKIRLMLYVATRTNALWQSRAIVVPEPETPRT